MPDDISQLKAALKDAEDEKIQLLDLDKLIAGSKATKEIILVTEEGRMKAVIRKLNTEDLGLINRYAGDDTIKNLEAMVFRGTVSPPISAPDKVGQLPVAVANALGTAIAEFSGLTPEAQEKMKSFLEKTESIPSG